MKIPEKSENNSRKNAFCGGSARNRHRPAMPLITPAACGGRLSQPHPQYSSAFSIGQR